LILSPDRKWLYYLGLADGKLARVDAASLKLDREMRLAEGTEALSLTPDGKTFVAVSARRGSADKSTLDGQIQVIDARKLAVTRAVAVPIVPYDVAATDSGLTFVSGAGTGWTDIAIVSLERQAVVARWGGVWGRSFLQLTPDQSRLYFSTQGVSPGQVEAFVIPKDLTRKPVPYSSPARGKQRLGGEFLITPDGKYLLCKTGTTLRLSSAADDDLRHHVTIEPFLSAAVDPDRAIALVVTPEGSVRVYSYPDFKLRGTCRLGAPAYQVAFDGAAMRLYAAVLDPKGLSERPRARGVGDIHVYDLKDVLKGTVTQASRRGR
jgi:hypothetical protein